MNPPPPPDVITDVHDLDHLWRALAGHGAHHGRSAYLCAHDANGRPWRQLVAVDGLPLRPAPEDLDGFGRLIDEMLRLRTRPSFVTVLLTRPGTARDSAFEQAWGAMLTRALGSRMRWPICLATPHGIRPLDSAS